MTWILALIYPPQIYLLLHRSFSFESGFCSLNAAVNLLLFVTGIAFVPVWFCLVWGLAHRRRPVVAIGDEEVEFGSIFRFAKRPVVPIAEIAALEGTPRKVRLRMRSGKGVPIGTPELSMDSRAAVRAALERRISGDPA
jgi:hypothetical protein